MAGRHVVADYCKTFRENCGLFVQVIDRIAKERKLQRPSVSYGAENLYMHGPLEELTRQNLTKVGN